MSKVDTTAATTSVSWRTYRAIPIVAIIAGVLAFLGSFAVSNKYLATTQLLVHTDTSYLSSTSSTDPSIPVVGSTDLATALSDTQTALTSSRSVAEAVVAKLKLDQVDNSRHGLIASVKGAASDAYHDARALLTYGSVPALSKHEAAVEDVQRSLVATQVKNSYVIAIGATWSDPEVAAQIANAAADELVAESKARYQAESKNYLDSLKSQLDQASKAQTAAQQALSDYDIAHGITDLSQQLLLTAQNTSQLQQQVTGLTAQIGQLNAELSSVEATLAKTPSTTTQSQTVQTGRSSTDITSTAPNTLYQSLATQAANLRAQIDGVTAQRDAIQKALTNTPAQSTPLTTTEAESARLALQANVATDNYQTLSKQYQQAVLAGDQSNIEVARIDSAAPPALPVGPIRYMYLLVGLVIGALLSFIVVHARVLQRARRADGISRSDGDGADDSRDAAGHGNGSHGGHIDLVAAERSAENATLTRQPTSVDANGHVPAIAGDAGHDGATE